MNTTLSHPSHKPSVGWITLLVVVAISLAGLIISPHANDHDEASVIRGCNNFLQVWLNKSCERLNVVKGLEDGRVGNHVVQPCKRGLLEITAYIVGGGSLEETVAALVAKGCTQVWP